MILFAILFYRIVTQPSTDCNIDASHTLSSCTLVNGVSGACDLNLNKFTFAGAHNAGSGSFGVMRLGVSEVEASKCFWQNQEISFTSMLRDYGMNEPKLVSVNVP